MRILAALGLVVVAALTGCENLETFTGGVRVAPAVAPAAPSRILLVINDDYRYPSETIEGMWGDREGGLHVLEPSARWSADAGFTGTPVFSPGETEPVTYWHQEFAYYPSQVRLGAFLDENGNLLPDPGEPWGEHPANPITDLPRHAPEERPIVADIEIDRVWP